MDTLLLLVIMAIVAYGNLLQACYFLAGIVVFGLCDIDHISLALAFILFTYINMGIYGLIYVIISIILCVTCMGLYLFGSHNINLGKLLANVTRIDVIVNACGPLNVAFNMIKHTYLTICNITDNCLEAVSSLIKNFRHATDDVVILGLLYYVFDLIHGNFMKVYSCCSQIQSLCNLAATFMSGGNSFASPKKGCINNNKKNKIVNNDNDNDNSLNGLDKILESTLKEFTTSQKNSVNTKNYR